jgi:hypothetical protein
MKLPRPREKHVQALILQFLRLRGAWAERFNSGGFTDAAGQFVRFNTATGCSDVLACYRGRMLALEVKRDGRAKATATQESFLADVRRAGGVGEVVSDVKQVEAILEAIDREIDA